MMTLKLVSEGRVRIFEAASFTITEEDFQHGPHYCRKVTAHDLVGDQEVACWWVGNPPYDVEEHRVYTAAYLMNSAGKTVEVLSCPIDIGRAQANGPRLSA